MSRKGVVKRALGGRAYGPVVASPGLARIMPARIAWITAAGAVKIAIIRTTRLTRSPIPSTTTFRGVNTYLPMSTSAMAPTR